MPKQVSPGGGAARAGAPGLAAELAERTLSLDPSALDPRTVAAATHYTIDALGVTLLGSGAEHTRLLLDTPGIAEGGPCRIFGTTRRASALDAALVNGTASHAYDFDDFNELFGGHPSVPVLSAVLPLAEARGASGREVLAAYVAGVEAESRIAMGVHFHHYEKGWHPTSTLGTLGAAAGCGFLLGLDVPRLAHALSIAASLASGFKANFGSMTKPLHVGHSARNGVFAALVAERGFTASPRAFEHPQGFLEVFNGAGTYDVERMLGRWYDPPLVLEPGVSLKQFPCCGSTHPAIAMALDLRRRHHIDPTTVTRVEVLTHPRRLPHTDKADPRNGLDGKFSMQYCVARALADGRVSLDHFEDEAVGDPAVRALMARVEVGVEPEMATRADRAFGAVVTVHRDAAEPVSARVEHMVGRGPDNPMRDDELADKFHDCARRALAPDRARAALAAAHELDRLERVERLTELLTPGGAASPVAADHGERATARA
ncbi:MAG: MmgE/PrpD family protein [Ectothiorhodospiraceae bacterium]|nr:MmgE/PrpD family protein [Chromatiales bacterium]MCP5154682.1 MmgE/PrpD family protein [Ectothiorhodospiraceae bacterium]